MSNNKLLENIISDVETLNKQEHIEILRILKSKNYNIKITENNNGCFINLNDVDEKILEQIQKFIFFITDKNKELDNYETLKNDILENYIEN